MVYAQCAVQYIPAKHGGVWFRLLFMCHGTDIKRSQVHTEQLRNPLSAIDVSVFIQHLGNKSQISILCRSYP